MAFTAYEQLLLELINRARLDPSAEAARLGIDLNAGLAAGTISATQKQALAPSGFLQSAALGHTKFMLATNQFAHQNIGDGTPVSRVQAAGYKLTGAWTVGENIAWTGTTGTPDVLAYTYQLADNLFKSASHRTNTLEAAFREVGTGISTGPYKYGSLTYNSVFATENFATSGTKAFVTGVAINDKNGNNFYDVGEARGGVTVSVSTGGVADGSAVTEAAGGYGVAVTPSGTHSVTFSGGGLAASVNVLVSNGSLNAKVDLSGTNKILVDSSVTLGSGAKDAVLLGVANINATGNALDNVIAGNKGANILTGGAGRDTLTGGLGADTFKFNFTSDSGVAAATRDIITDFTHNNTLALSDRIDLFAIDANTKIAGDNAFIWVNNAAFSGAAGQLHYRTEDLAGTVNDKTVVEGDVNGDRVADFTIELTGLKALQAADFIL